jgi:DNA-binding transcriptional LysR family regulator
MQKGLVRLDLGKLEVFLEATRQGSYTAAAKRLNVTQSAVSHAIRKLEEGIGRPLVEWQRRRFRLTDEGQYVRQICEQVFHDLVQAEQVLSARVPGGTQVMTIGATVEFGTTVLVRKLRPLLDAAPWLHIDFRFHDDLAQSLLRDEIDLAVDCAPHTDPSVQATRLFREKYVLVASPAFLESHQLRRPIDLEQVPVLSADKEGAWWTNALRSIPGLRRPVLRRIIGVNQVRGMVHAALEGYGVALLPKYTVRGKVERGELVALFPRLPLVEEWFCVHQKRTSAGREKNRIVTDFLLRLDVAEFGDAIRGPSPELPRSQRRKEPAAQGARRGR